MEKQQMICYKNGSSIDELMYKYREQFDDQFPIMLCRHMSKEEIIEIIKDCIEKDKQYEPKLDPKADY